MRQLPTAEELFNSESLSPAVIASQVQSDIKHKQKIQLQQDFEPLKVAHIASEEAIRAEKEKSDALQQELDLMKARYEELQSKYKAAGQRNMQLFYEERIRQEQNLSENLRAEKDNPRETVHGDRLPAGNEETSAVSAGPV